MYLGWCWEKSPSDCIEQLYGGKSQNFSKWLQLLRKPLQLFLDHGAVDAPDLSPLQEQMMETIKATESLAPR